MSYRAPIEEKQAEMENMVKEAWPRRETLLDITSREVRGDMFRLGEEMKKMNTAKARGEEPSNCTEGPVRQERLE
jgi:hypothetical protein